MDNNYKILNTINSPDDLKKLNIESINLLADEIALYIHNTISRNRRTLFISFRSCRFNLGFTLCI